MVFLVYSLFTAVLGQNGLYARKHLEAERLQLVENLRALERSNVEFLRTKESLMYDHDALSVYARQLGYGRQDEEFIRIMGLSVAINAGMPVGQVQYAATPVYVPDKTIKIIALLFGLAILIFFITMDFLAYKTGD